jgi:hypothetical protein
MKMISQFMSLGEAVLLKLIRTEGFPAKKILGTWFSCPEAIQDWIRGKVMSPLVTPDQEAPPAPAKTGPASETMSPRETAPKVKPQGQKRKTVKKTEPRDD